VKTKQKAVAIYLAPFLIFILNVLTYMACINVNAEEPTYKNHKHLCL